MNEPVVLVVDDSPTVRKIVQLTLQREQMRVITASDGLSALAAVADEDPDLILLDIIPIRPARGLLSLPLCGILRLRSG